MKYGIETSKREQNVIFISFMERYSVHLTFVQRTFKNYLMFPSITKKHFFLKLDILNIQRTFRKSIFRRNLLTRAAFI